MYIFNIPSTSLYVDICLILNYCTLEKFDDVRPNEKRMFPVAHTHYLLASKFAGSYLKRMMCVLKIIKEENTNTRKKTGYKNDFDLNMLKTSDMVNQIKYLSLFLTYLQNKYQNG